MAKRVARHLGQNAKYMENWNSGNVVYANLLFFFFIIVSVSPYLFQLQFINQTFYFVSFMELMMNTKYRHFVNLIDSTLHHSSIEASLMAYVHFHTLAVVLRMHEHRKACHNSLQCFYAGKNRQQEHKTKILKEMKNRNFKITTEEVDIFCSVNNDLQWFEATLSCFSIHAFNVHHYWKQLFSQ